MKSLATSDLQIVSKFISAYHKYNHRTHYILLTLYFNVPMAIIYTTKLGSGMKGQGTIEEVSRQEMKMYRFMTTAVETSKDIKIDMIDKIKEVLGYDLNYLKKEQ